MKARSSLNVFATAFILTVIATLAWQIDTAKGQVVKDGLISYWTFDDADIEDDTVRDVWGEHHGTIMHDPKVVEGKVAQALELDGIDDYVDCGSSFNFRDSDFSIESWIRVDDDDTSYIICFKDTADNNPHIEFYTNYLAAGNLGAHMLDSRGSGFRTTYASSDVTDSQWHHVAMVFKHKENTVELYLDGKLTVSGTGSIIDALDNFDWGSIGKSHKGELMDGAIDELCIYDRVLSVDEINRNMEAKGFAAIESANKLAETWGGVKASK